MPAVIKSGGCRIPHSQKANERLGSRLVNEVNNTTARHSTNKNQIRWLFPLLSISKFLKGNREFQWNCGICCVSSSWWIRTKTNVQWKIRFKISQTLDSDQIYIQSRFECADFYDQLCTSKFDNLLQGPAAKHPQWWKSQEMALIALPQSSSICGWSLDVTAMRL